MNSPGDWRLSPEEAAYVVGSSEGNPSGSCTMRLLEIGIVMKSPWGPTLTPLGELVAKYEKALQRAEWTSDG